MGNARGRKRPHRGAHGGRGGGVGQGDGPAGRTESAQSPADAFEAQLSLAAELQHAGRDKDAERIYRRILAGTPEHTGARFGLGVLLHRRGDDAGAIGFLEATARDWPQHPESRYLLGVSLCRLRRFADAARELETALRQNVNVAEICNYLGITMAELGRSREAERYLQRALRQRPNFVEAYENLGTLLSEQGRAAEAQAALRKALALRPGSAKAWRHLSTLRTFAKDDADLAAMEALHGDATLSDEQRMELAFALGKAYHDIGQYPRAFGRWQEANALQRRLSRYDVRPVLAEMEAIVRTFSAQSCALPPGEDPGGPAPIFIVGMPRSGTSLVEQVLASHTQVHGAGELSLLDDLLRAAAPRFPQDLVALDAAGWREIGQRYAQETGTLAGGAAFVTDKQPANFLHLGAIRRLFPRARIVHCRRDPQDTALSCYRTHFIAPVLGYTSDLGDLGAFYRQYEALMAHWRAAGVPFHEVVYEALVASPESEIRALLAACALEFEPACLEPHRNRRPVRTASGVQVRQPIHRASVEAWRHYERELKPFRLAREGSWQARLPRFGALASRITSRRPN